MADALTPTEVTLVPGTVFIRQGEVSREVFYWIAGGTVRILVDGKPIREITRDPAAPSFFGDLAALLNRPRSSTLECVTENRFLHIPFPSEGVDPFLNLAPTVSQHWLVALAKTSYDSIESLKGKQPLLDAARERLKAVERTEAGDKRKWGGALFVTEKIYSKVKHPSVGGVFRYMQKLKFFGLDEGKSTDTDPKLYPQDLKTAMF